MNDFEKLVYEMRSAQINYFRTRSKEVLEQSKQLEKRVDKYLIDKKINQQTSFQAMNEVSIIINGVRYDAVINPNDAVFYNCTDCALLDMCKAHCKFNLCEYLGVNFGYCFKKSDKKFER